MDIYPPEVDSFTIENTPQKESKKRDQEEWTQRATANATERKGIVTIYQMNPNSGRRS